MPNHDKMGKYPACHEGALSDGRLHRFMWLEEADMGEVPVTWNFLVGHNAVADGAGVPKAIHFTSGGPWFETWKECQFAEWWVKERDDYWNTVCAPREGRQPEERKLLNSGMHEGTPGMHPDGQLTRLKDGSYSIADFMSNALCL